MRRGGFTLIELLVVIAIIGIAAAAVALSVSSGPSRLVDEETARLGALFRLAQDEVRTTGRSLVWEADRNGYRFRATDGETFPQSSDDPLRARPWPFPVERIDAPPIAFGREPLMLPAVFRLTVGGQECTFSLDALGNVSRRE